MKTYRTGIVGTTHLSSHISGLNAAPRVELVAAAAHTDTEKDQFQEGGMSTIYPSYEEMFANADLDIVEIDTDPIQRYDMTLAAVRSGVSTSWETSLLLLHSSTRTKWSRHVTEREFNWLSTISDDATPTMSAQKRSCRKDSSAISYRFERRCAIRFRRDTA